MDFSKSFFENCVIFTPIFRLHSPFTLVQLTMSSYPSINDDDELFREDKHTQKQTISSLLSSSSSSSSSSVSSQSNDISNNHSNQQSSSASSVSVVTNKYNVTITPYDPDTHFISEWIEYFQQQVSATSTNQKEWSSKLYLNLPMNSRIRNLAYSLCIQNKDYKFIKQEILSTFHTPATIRQAASDLASFNWSAETGTVDKHVDAFIRILKRCGKDVDSIDVNGSNVTLDDPSTIEQFTRKLPLGLRKLINNSSTKFASWWSTIDTIKDAEAEYSSIRRMANGSNGNGATSSSSSDNKLIDLSYHNNIDPYSNNDFSTKSDGSESPSSTTVLHVRTRGRGGYFRGSRGGGHRGGRGGSYSGHPRKRSTTIYGSNACTFHLTAEGCFKGDKCPNSHDPQAIAEAYKNLHLNKSKGTLSHPKDTSY